MWVQRIFLLILLIFLTSPYAQKISEEEPVEGSANAISPDDEDFEEGSGLPPEEREHKPTSVKPNFVTEHGIERPIVTQSVAISASTTTLRTRIPVKPISTTQKPSSSFIPGGLNSTMILLGIGAIIVIIVLIIIIVVCCRKKSSRNDEYTPGTQRSKSHV